LLKEFFEQQQQCVSHYLNVFIIFVYECKS
jgi:hypothetical protein